MIKSYKDALTFFLVFIISYLFCFSSGYIYSNYTYNQALEQYKHGQLSTKPTPGVLPRDFNIIYNDIYHLSDQNNLLLIGSSTVMNGIFVDNSTIPNKWNIKNLAIGGGIAVREMILMVNYLNNYANHKPDKSDVVVIHVFYSSFKDPPTSERFVSQVIEAYNVYQIDDNLQVHGYMPAFYREWMYSKAIIMYPLSSLTGINMFSVSSTLLAKLLSIYDTAINLFIKSSNQNPIEQVPQNTPHSESDIAEYKRFWKAFSKDIYFPNSETEKFKHSISDLKDQTNIVVVNMYLPSWQKDIAQQKEYVKWTETDLIPFLNGNNIAYIDFSDSFKDEEFIDSGHLTTAGREHFTELFDDKMKPILSSISD